MKSIIVAYDRERVIGRENDLPWAGQLPGDLQHFREQTIGSTVIMGRRTFESLPPRWRPLPDRQNIILSLAGYAAHGAQTATSLQEAYDMAEHEDSNIIGGAQIYTLALPTVDRVIATEIDAAVEGDAYFTPLPSHEWEESDRSPLIQKDARDAFAYSFVTYLRRRSINSQTMQKG